MDKSNNRNCINLSHNDLTLLESRIIEACKHIDTDFTADTERIRLNVNILFDANYGIEEVSYVIGTIYEKQFYHNQEITY
jgi:hypothetical protein